MKTSTKLGLFALAVGAAFGIERATRKSGPAEPKNSSNGTTKDTRKFLFIGDSLTAFDKSYADQLKAIRPSIAYKKIAKIGEKTDWMLKQLQDELSTGAKYDVITIWGGVNDIYARGSITSAKANLQAMYDLAKKSGAKVVALTVIPTATYTRSTPKMISLTREINDWIKANKTVSQVVVDVNKIMNDGKDGTKANYLQSDTLHLTRVGQTEIMIDYSNRV